MRSHFIHFFLSRSPSTSAQCSPPGYSDYFAAHPDLPSSYWTQGVTDCTPPYPNDGTRSTTWPERELLVLLYNTACSEACSLTAKPDPLSLSLSIRILQLRRDYRLAERHAFAH